MVVSMLRKSCHGAYSTPPGCPAIRDVEPIICRPTRSKVIVPRNWLQLKSPNWLSRCWRPILSHLLTPDRKRSPIRHVLWAQMSESEAADNPSIASTTLEQACPASSPDHNEH